MGNGIVKSAKLLLPAIILILLFSCSMEKKLARQFVRNDTSRTVLVIPPYFLYKISLKDYEVDNAEELTEWELDSVLYENSIFLQYVWDSIFIQDYYNSYCNGLTELGYSVYPEDSLQNFLQGKPDAFIFNLAQLELEEYVMPVVEKEEFEDYLYYQVFNLNAINVNSWLEISSMNEEESKELFFSSLFLTDELEGYFRYNYFTGDVKYYYELDSLNLDMIYDLGELAGSLYASYTFDYFMNKFIDQRMQELGKWRSRIYYHYDWEHRYIRPAKEDEKFIPMED